MIELSTDIELPLPPCQVWAVLVDFPSYPMWNPYVAVRGVATRGAEIEWSYPTRFIEHIWTPAVINELDEPYLLTWSIRLGWLLTLEESFSLQRIQNGTRLRHSAKCRGVVVKLRERTLSQTLTKALTCANDGLYRYITTPRMNSPAPVMRADPLRGKGRRKKLRRHRVARR